MSSEARKQYFDGSQTILIKASGQYFFRWFLLFSYPTEFSLSKSYFFFYLIFIPTLFTRGKRFLRHVRPAKNFSRSPGSWVNVRAKRKNNISPHVAWGKVFADTYLLLFSCQYFVTFFLIKVVILFVSFLFPFREYLLEENFATEYPAYLRAARSHQSVFTSNQ